VHYANFAPYLRTTWHDLSVAGDLRSQYAPFDNPPSGAVAFSYIKCETTAGSTPLQLVMRNFTEKPSSGSWSYSLITRDSDLYFSPPLTWTNAPFGTGGQVVVKPGGQFSSGVFSIATPDPNKTLVLRAQLSGAPLRIQSLSPGTAEDY
jgi:hypothetical protein